MVGRVEGKMRQLLSIKNVVYVCIRDFEFRFSFCNDIFCFITFFVCNFSYLLSSPSIVIMLPCALLHFTSTNKTEL